MNEKSGVIDLMIRRKNLLFYFFHVLLWYQKGFVKAAIGTSEDLDKKSRGFLVEDFIL